LEHLSEIEADERSAISKQILDMDRRLVTLLRAGLQSDFLQSDLTMPQLKVLLLLASEEGGHLHMSRLAQCLRVTMPTATGIVDRLVEQGLLHRQHSPRDRRLVEVGLTESGRDLIERLRAADRKRLESVLSRLSLDDLKTVARGLDLLLEAVTEYVRDGGCQPGEEAPAAGHLDCLKLESGTPAGREPKGRAV